MLRARPLEEAISSSGGLHLKRTDQSMMLKKLPGVFAAGEMLDWDVPTGGFLIQGCVSQGFCAGQGILSYLQRAIRVKTGKTLPVWKTHLQISSSSKVLLWAAS